MTDTDLADMGVDRAEEIFVAVEQLLSQLLSEQAVREQQLVAIVEAVARADNDDYIGEIKVDIPAGGYPRQSLLTAARAAIGDGGHTDAI